MLGNFSFGSIVTYIGLILMIHAGYSAHHFRRLMISSDEDLSLPPNDVIIECYIAFALVIFGQVYPIKLVPVRYSKSSNMRRWNDSFGTQDFSTFNHRGRLIGNRK